MVALLFAAGTTIGCSKESPAPVALVPAGEARLPISAPPMNLQVLTGVPVREPTAQWQSVGANPADTELIVTWTDSPDAGCGQVTAARLNETADDVVVQLLMSAVTATTVCSAGGAGHQAPIPLAAPLGARKLLAPEFGADGLTLK